MLGILQMIGRLYSKTSTEPKTEPHRQSRWVVDLPPREAIRLGAFRTKEEAYDARREYTVSAIREVEPIELPF